MQNISDWAVLAGGVSVILRRAFNAAKKLRSFRELNLLVRTALWNRFLRLPAGVLELEASMSRGPKFFRMSVAGKPQGTRFKNLFSGIELFHESPERWTYLVEDCTLDTQFGVVMWQKQLIAESTPWPALQIAVDMNLQKQIRLRRFLPLAGTVTAFPSNTYYHFLMEDVPALLATVDAFPDAVVAIPPRTTKYVDEFLTGLTQAKVVCQRARVGTAVFAGKQGVCGFPQADDISRLRAHFLGGHEADEAAVAPKRRAYVSRRFSRRPVPDEEQIELIAQEHGFQVLHLENLALSDQVQIFRNLAEVVGFHGAGLSNLAFAPSGVMVSEVFSGEYVNHCFEHLTRVVGGRYQSYLVEEESSEGYRKAFEAAFSTWGKEKA